MPFPTMPDPAADRAHEVEASRHPERETLELATAGNVRVLVSDALAQFRPDRLLRRQ